MKNCLAMVMLLPFVLLVSTAESQLPAPEPTAQPTQTIAVTINGRPLLESQIEEAFEGFWNQRTQGRPMPAGAKEQMRQKMRPEILEVLINDALLDEQASQAKIEVTEQELVDRLKAALKNHLARTGATEEEFKAQLQGRNTTLEQFLKERSSDAGFRKAAVHDKLLEQRSPTELTVSAEEVEARYQQDLATVYTKPQQVKASHILIGIKSSSTAEEKAAAQAKTREILDQARGPAADFGALASEYSSCPSRAKGGDLGYFPREGVMVEPFAAAAFALPVGGISDVVETQFGYHIIKVTDRQEPSVQALAQTSEMITEDLKREKLAKAKEKLTAELRQNAQITYPG